MSFNEPLLDAVARAAESVPGCRSSLHGREGRGHDRGDIRHSSSKHSSFGEFDVEGYALYLSIYDSHEPCHIHWYHFFICSVDPVAVDLATITELFELVPNQGGGDCLPYAICQSLSGSAASDLAQANMLRIEISDALLARRAEVCLTKWTIVRSMVWTLVASGMLLLK